MSRGLGGDGSLMSLLIHNIWTLIDMDALYQVLILSNLMHALWLQPRQHPDGGRLHSSHSHLLEKTRICKLSILCSILSPSNSTQAATLATSWSHFSLQSPQLSPHALLSWRSFTLMLYSTLCNLLTSESSHPSQPSDLFVGGCRILSISCHAFTSWRSSRPIIFPSQFIHQELIFP